MVSARQILCVVLALAGLVSGCVDGPFGGLPAINPWVQKDWARDERFGPTFYRRLTDLQGLRATVAKLDPPKKEEIVGDMARLLPREPNPVLRAEIVGVLGEAGIPTAIPSLETALGDSDKDVRISACRALAKTGGGTAVPILSGLMESETDVDVRLAAIRELGRFQDPAAVAALGRALDDENPAVQHLAVQSLKTASGRDYGDSVPAWREFVQGREPQVPAGPSLVERVTNLF